jgi:2-C-methyl-D-erythritol 4-phosphate cytidylyltransferase
VSALPHTVTVVVFTDGNDSVDDGAIDRMVESLMTLGVHAVIPSVAATEAVKRVQAGLVVESIDRSTLNPLRTPEVVDRRFLEAALAGVDGSQPVNPSRLVASAGGLVHVDR